MLALPVRTIRPPRSRFLVLSLGRTLHISPCNATILPSSHLGEVKVGAIVSSLPRFTTHISPSRESAIDDLKSQFSHHKIIYTDASGYDSKVGAAAVMKTEKGDEVVRRKFVGPRSEWTVYEGELVGIILATDIIKEMKLSGKVAIMLDNQTAVTLTKRRKNGRVQHKYRRELDMLLLAWNLIMRTLRDIPNLEITLAWIPGHEGVKGNEWADKEAQKAAMGDLTSLFEEIQELSNILSSTAIAKIREEATPGEIKACHA